MEMSRRHQLETLADTMCYQLNCHPVSIVRERMYGKLVTAYQQGRLSLMNNLRRHDTLRDMATSICNYMCIQPTDHVVQPILDLLQSAYEWGLTDAPYSPDIESPNNSEWMAPMNYSTVICLVSPDVRGISCCYEFESDGETPKKIYTYKSLDTTIVKDDLVVVPTNTRMGFTVVKVIECDVEIEIESSIEYKWIAGRFDKTVYDELLRQEDMAISRIKKAKKTRARRELKETILEDVDESDLTSLPVFRGEMPQTSEQIASMIAPAPAPVAAPDEEDYSDVSDDDGTQNDQPDS